MTFYCVVTSIEVTYNNFVRFSKLVSQRLTKTIVLVLVAAENSKGRKLKLKASPSLFSSVTPHRRDRSIVVELAILQLLRSTEQCRRVVGHKLYPNYGNLLLQPVYMYSVLHRLLLSLR